MNTVDADTSSALVHYVHQQTLAEHTKSMMNIADYNPPEDSVGDKLSREARMLTWGVGEAFGGAVSNPISKAPELATAGAFGVGIKMLSKAGTGGKTVAGIVGAGLMAKMGFDEWRGNRWTEFGDAMGATWQSRTNLDSSIEATKNSVGSLAVDLAVGTIGYKAAGLHDSVGARSNLWSRDRLDVSVLPLRRSPHGTSGVTEFSLMGERLSRSLGDTPFPLRPVSKPTSFSELRLMGERCADVVKSGSEKTDLITRGSSEKPLTIESPRSRVKDSVPDAKVRTHISGASPDAVAPTTHAFADSLKTKLLHGKVEEFGYLSAIREVACSEAMPMFKPTRDSYETIAGNVRALAKDADPEFAREYLEVARLVEAYARSL
jgi:hypothetical protein